MKAFAIQGSFGLDALRLVDLPEPTPGPGQVVLRMKAASLNYRDVLVVKGLYNPKFRLPLVPFSDGVGEVIGVGEGVTRVKVGDRVCPIFNQRWIDGELTASKARGALGGELPGVLSEQVLVSEEGVVAAPAHLTDEEAASLPCAAVTAWNALFAASHLKAGDTVLVQGTGGVSIFALQLARLAGARVIVTSSSDEKLERARSLGASETINYRATPDWDTQALSLTRGAGVDHVVEVGGAGTIARSLRAVRTGGRVSVIGVLSGGAPELSLFPFLMKQIVAQGVFVGSRAMFEDMNRAIAAGGLRPVVDRVFPFGEVRQALDHMASGGHFGKIALRF
ncbi:zinc-dependent alcohol dehydrogenase family protein [Sorangium cellulosum]|uniref:NADPH:quinone oxidoreductase n=1 Tax=Sorangium cellulosum TaxID=56 RepID=A0A150QXR2_SORCE|nr:NAD(P)-dependent alcohol dehydrogenase [Sorangium cellulosum]KYF72764.1 NADPH:quinone oxidoreductase [Sorangium cellulosum]